MKQMMEVLDSVLNELELKLASDLDNCTSMPFYVRWSEHVVKECEDKDDSVKQSIRRRPYFSGQGCSRFQDLPDGFYASMETLIEVTVEFDEDCREYGFSIRVDKGSNSTSFQYQYDSFWDKYRPTIRRAKKLIKKAYRLTKNNDVLRIDKALVAVNSNRIDNILLEGANEQEKPSTQRDKAD